MIRSHGNFRFRLVVEQKRGENGADVNEFAPDYTTSKPAYSAGCPTISTSSVRLPGTPVRRTWSGSGHFAVSLWAPLEPRVAATCEG